MKAGPTGHHSWALGKSGWGGRPRSSAVSRGWGLRAEERALPSLGEVFLSARPRPSPQRPSWAKLVLSYRVPQL